jgi:flagellar biogenesis protein FliO
MIALTAKTKALAAGALLGALVLATIASRTESTTMARVALGIVSVAGLGYSFARSKKSGLCSRFRQTQRLEIIERSSISAKTGAALIEVDGQSFLIVHSDAGTHVRRLKSRASMVARRLSQE